MKYKIFFSPNAENTNSSKLYTTTINEYNLFVLITLIGSEPFNSHSNSNLIWDRIQEVFSTYETDSTVKKLEECLKKTRQFLVMLIRNDPNFHDIGIDLHVSAIAIKGNRMYVGNFGDNDIFLLRDKPVDIGKLIYNSDKMFQTGSGELENNDILMISSPSTIDAYIETQLDLSQSKALFYKSISSDFEYLSKEFSSSQNVTIIEYNLPTVEEPAEIKDETEAYSNNNLVENQTQEEIATSETEDNTISEEIEKTPEILNTQTDSSQTIQNEENVLPIKTNTNNNKFKDIFLRIKELLNKYYLIIKPKLILFSKKIIELLNKLKDKLIKKNIIPQNEVPTLKDNDVDNIDLSKINTANTTPSQPQLLKRSLYKNQFVRKFMSYLSRIPIRPRLSPRKFNLPIKTNFYKNRFVILGIVSVIIIGGLYLVIKNQIVKNNYQKNLSEITQTITNIGNEISNVETTVKSPSYNRDNVNSQITSVRDKIRLIDMNSLKENDKNNFNTTLGDYSKRLLKVSNTINLITAINENSNMKFIGDTILMCEGEDNPKDFAINEPYLVVVGESKRTICIINMSNNDSRVVDKSHSISEQPVSVAAHGNGFYIFDSKKGLLDLRTYDSNGSIKSISTIEPTQVTGIIKSSTGEISDIEIYGDRGEENVYYLSVSEGKVKKSTFTGGSLSLPQEYFVNDFFTQGKDIMIDGSIYIVTNTSNKIIKYFAGQPESIEISNMVYPIGIVGKGYTSNSELEPIYLIDKQPDYQRIIVLEKPYSIIDGNGNVTDIIHPGKLLMVNQLVYQGDKPEMFQNLKELTYDSIRNRLIILDDSKLVTVDL